MGRIERDPQPGANSLGVEQGRRRGAQLRWLGWEHGEDVQGSHTSPLREKGKSPLLLKSSVFPEHGLGRSLSELQGRRLAQEGNSISPTWLMAQIPGVIFVKLLGGRPPPGASEPGGEEPWNLYPDSLRALTLQRVWEAGLNEGSVCHTPTVGVNSVPSQSISVPQQPPRPRTSDLQSWVTQPRPDLQEDKWPVDTGGASKWEPSAPPGSILPGPSISPNHCWEGALSQIIKISPAAIEGCFL